MKNQRLTRARMPTKFLRRQHNRRPAGVEFYSFPQRRLFCLCAAIRSSSVRCWDARAGFIRRAASTIFFLFANVAYVWARGKASAASPAAIPGIQVAMIRRDMQRRGENNGSAALFSNRDPSAAFRPGKRQSDQTWAMRCRSGFLFVREIAEDLAVRQCRLELADGGFTGNTLLHQRNWFGCSCGC